MKTLPTSTQNQPPPINNHTSDPKEVNEAMWTGHLWEKIHPKCYNQCKEEHSIFGLACVTTCISKGLIELCETVQKIRQL